MQVPEIGKRSHLPALIVFVLFFMPTVCAGQPFRTDEPEPVEYGYWEYYTAIEYQNNKGNLFGTVPQLELNHGVAPNVQLHLLASCAYNRLKGRASNFGPGDVELGLKYRFVQESDRVPMVGTYPYLELPTGSRERRLGAGHFQMFLPLWLQKSWGPWTARGGGGYWINPGAGNKNFWFSGWVLQVDLTAWLTVGAEVFHFTRPAADTQSQTAYNIGAIIDFSERYHFVTSAGTGIRGPANFFCYGALLLTWGPGENGRKGTAAK